MASVINILKGLIGKEDLNIGSGTFLRRRSDGTTQTMTKVGIGSFVDTVFYVDDFGAVGDGITDDSGAIQAAVDAATNNSGGVVLFGAKNYLTAATITVGTAVTLVGLGRRSKVTVSSDAALSSAFLFQIANSEGRFGGSRDLHVDCNSGADYAFYIDSWNAAEFSAIEINNAMQAGFYITSNQNADSDHHLFDHVWVRDDISTSNVGSRFAVLRAGSAGKPTDCTFRDCIVQATSAFSGSTVYLWDIADSARIKLQSCRVSSSKTFNASVWIGQQSTPPAGALVGDVQSGYCVVEDFYHETQGVGNLTAIIIEGARDTSGQFNRNNVIRNLDCQPTATTHVHFKNTGATNLCFNNSVELTKRQVANPLAVVVDAGCLSTFIRVHGASDTIVVGTDSSSEVQDFGSGTYVNGIKVITSAAGTEGTRPIASTNQANFGDIIHDTLDDRIYLRTVSGAMRQISSEPCLERFVTRIDFDDTTVDFGALPADVWVNVKIWVQTAFNGTNPTLNVGVASDTDFFANSARLGVAGLVEFLVGDGRTQPRYRSSGGTLRATLSPGASTQGVALVIVEFFRVPSLT